ncbi:TlpA family protein disulfide reductase [Nocardia bovistercoris]|uniref:Redoxin family protein n=1 Tax=Nocardia bovistercoris TaxID=2785916 RepID=A0A931N1Z9_9NOCA|nr:MauE/DoxX family redox-associated membrane protein [Nocardia bovistercoris]MBH0778970.1 redoxin family protein [Nocardia bovistercoris]
MLIEYGVWVSRLVVGVVFGLAAWGKIFDRVGTLTAVTDFGVPVRWAPAVAYALPVVEVVVAVGMLPAATALLAAGVALILLAIFTVAVLRLLARGQRPACSCFGALSATPIGSATVVRNGVLAALVLLAAVGSAARPEVPAGLPVRDIVGLALVALVAAVLIRLHGAVDGLRKRLDAQALSTLGAEGLPVGAVAPEFELLDVDGARTTLESLLARGASVLLVFVHPGCEMCAALARELPRWRARTGGALSIVVVGNGDAEEQAAWGAAQGLGEIPSLVQQGNEAALRYRVRGTPSGVLVDADGRVAAPVARGAIAVRELILSVKAGRRPQTVGREDRRAGSPV